MMKLGTRRGWGSMLLVALLTVAVLTSVYDACICIDAASSAGIAADASDGSNVPPVEVGGKPLCLHAHCHHWVGVARATERLDFTLAEGPAGAFFALYSPPAAAPPHELLRPPRA